MQWDSVFAVVALDVAIGLAILLVIWPVTKNAVKLLRRWGVPNPTEADVAEALTYLKRRRYWYLPLLIGLPFLDEWLHVLPSTDFPTTIVITLIVGGLLAELLAQRRPKRAHREALLVRRKITDLVQWWAIPVFVAAFAVSITRLVQRREWTDAGANAVIVVITALIVVLAVRKPVSGTVEVDLALRMRSARVAIALGSVFSIAGFTWPPTAWSGIAAITVIVVALSTAAPLKRVPVPT